MEELFTLLFNGVALLLGKLAKEIPGLGILLGTNFVAVPVLQWLSFDKKYFYTDGSPAGLVLFFVYVYIGLFCFGLGAFMLSVGFKTLRGEQVDLIAELAKRNTNSLDPHPYRTLAIVIVIVMLIIAYLLRSHF